MSAIESIVLVLSVIVAGGCIAAMYQNAIKSADRQFESIQQEIEQRHPVMNDDDDDDDQGPTYPWWQHPTFPLVPTLMYRAATKCEASNFRLTWLGLRIYIMDLPGLEARIFLDDMGAGISLTLTYLNLVLAVPFPGKWTDWLMSHLDRAPPYDSAYDEDEGYDGDHGPY